jgi:hypothetical protein
MPQLELDQQVYDEGLWAYRIMQLLDEQAQTALDQPTTLPAFFNVLVRLGLNSLLAHALSEQQVPATVQIIQELAWQNPSLVFGQLVKELSGGTGRVRHQQVSALVRGVAPAALPG